MSARDPALEVSKPRFQHFGGFAPATCKGSAEQLDMPRGFEDFASGGAHQDGGEARAQPHSKRLGTGHLQSEAFLKDANK